MAKPAKKNEKPVARRGGSTFIGILIGLVLGLFIALAVAWYINKLPNPFKGVSQPPRVETPPPAAAPQPKVATPPPSEKPKVSVEDVPTKPKDSTPTADNAASEPKSTPAAKETFFLQTGSFQNAPEADTLKARLALLGLEATIQTRNLQDKGTWHRVRVGPYTDVDELNRVRDVLKQNNIDVALVKVREPDK